MLLYSASDFTLQIKCNANSCDGPMNLSTSLVMNTCASLCHPCAPALCFKSRFDDAGGAIVENYFDPFDDACSRPPIYTLPYD
jgi:hypothetical protein